MQMPDCLNCTEKCPQAERAHETAKGRLYATQELVELVKKIESGQLVEVVRCKDCEHNTGEPKCLHPDSIIKVPKDNDFCSYGRRKET